MKPNTMVDGSQLVANFQEGRENLRINKEAIVDRSFKVSEKSIKGLNFGLEEEFGVD